MSLFSRARKHIDMNRVKELREEKVRKIKHERTAEIWKQQESYFAELKKIEQKEDSRYSNWRKELKEGMTTAGLGMINLNATGDVDIVDNATALIGFEGQNAAVSGGTVTLTDDGDNDIADGTHTAFRQAYYTVDGSKSSHLKITILKGGGTSSWTDRGESWDDDVTLVVSDAANFFAPTYQTYNLTSGTHIVKLPGNYKNTRVQVQQFAKLASDGSPGTTGSLKIYNVSFQRRTPVNIFVPLDDPEANSFIRNGVSGNLSPEEKKKKIEQQLQSSSEYLTKMFGEGIFTGATEISDVEPQQPFKSDMQTGDNPDIDGTVLAGFGLRPDGTQGLSMPGDIVPDHNGNPMKLVPDPSRGRGFNRWVPVKKAGGGGTMVAHHEPEGEVLVEKESKIGVDKSAKIA